MKNQFFSFITIMFLFLSLSIFALVNKPDEISIDEINIDTERIKYLSGLWVDVNYHKVLLETGSLFKAQTSSLEKSQFILLMFGYENGQFCRFYADLNDSGDDIVAGFRKEGNKEHFRIGNDYAKDATNDDYLVFNKNKTITWTYNFSEPFQTEYIKVASFDSLDTEEFYRWFNNTLIAGNYIDSNGKIYRFSENGEAEFPDEKLNFRLNLVYYDSTIVENFMQLQSPHYRKKICFFKRTGDTLFLSFKPSSIIENPTDEDLFKDAIILKKIY